MLFWLFQYILRRVSIVYLAVTYTLLFVGLYFQVFLLYTFIEFILDEKEEGKQLADTARDYEPSVSVLVPCYNEEATVAGTLDSLLTLDYPIHKLNIIVIDDGSTDDTARVLENYAHYPQITLLYKENEGSKYHALNKGLEYVETEIVGCLDADSFVQPNTLREMIQVFTLPNTDAVIPTLLIHTPRNLLQRIQKVEFEMGLFFKKMFDLIDGLYIAPGPFSLFRREVFEELGNYRHAHNTEDCEIALRMRKHFKNIRHAQQAVVYTVGVPKFKQLFRQRVRWVYGGLRNKMDYSDMMFNRKYGDLGMFVMPFSLISQYIVSIAVVALLISTIVNIITRINQVVQAGTFSWSLFSFGGNPVLWINLLLLVIVLLTIYIGRYMIGFRKRITLDMFYGIILLGFISPLWVVTSVWHTLRPYNRSWY